ncbi:signal transduction histidine kinase [Methanohalobium evestigatum Z-7303]|uniref:Signal transduction histidine kinase n=1 Tax=Methanohalobium evestigatum (strain ATCC BAA-1072 / DSM 3721 / NBRC 107634 / OCM 161 / Z-7303) TaxID=644295 RepID=D7EAD4_METEZ|nr:PAS domain S-box protein [Methanohalobium evestigatum]ADI74933.1 signal transduction histidine kinase [Methanohalobium evestigatum Z-7303]
MREENKKLHSTFSEAEDMLGIGSAEWDIEHDVATLSEGWKKILGVKKEQMSLDESLNIVHPDDLPAVKADLQNAIDNYKPYSIKHRIICQDNGEIRYIKVYGKITRFDSTKPVKIHFTMQDVTKNEKLKDELQKKVDDFYYLYNNLNDAVFILDIDGYILDINKTTANRLGYSKQELLSLHTADIDCLYNEINTKKQIQKIIENRQKVFESVHIKRNGKKLPVEINSTFIKYEGKPAILSVARDITERKHAERLIQRKIKEQKALLSSTPALVYLKDNKLNYLTVNDAFCKVVDSTVENIKGKTDFDLFPEKEAEKYRSYDTSVMEAGEPVYNLEESYTTPEGEKRWALTSKVPYYDFEGNVIGIVGSSLDITERKQMYEKLYKSEKEKEVILNSTSEQITYQDLNYNIIWCNKAAFDHLGLDYNDIIGMRCYKLWIGANVNTICENCPVEACIKTGEHSEGTMGTPDFRVFHVSADPVRDSNGNIIGIIKILNDITERVKNRKKLKKYSEQLEKINRELEKRVQDKTEQIKNAERMRELELHHRVKNNLQVISSLLSLQSEKFDDEEVYEAFKDTQNRVVSMALVHEKLYRTNHLENIDLNDYVNDLVNHLKGLYDGGNISLNIDVQNIYFELDTIIPFGMLINEIVSNSLKYAFSEDESGEVTIKLSQDEEGYNILIIADNGRGISENVNIKESESLGLQLVNSLVDQLNGNFELDTSNGTKFIIEFYSS